MVRVRSQFYSYSLFFSVFAERNGAPFSIRVLLSNLLWNVCLRHIHVVHTKNGSNAVSRIPKNKCQLLNGNNQTSDEKWIKMGLFWSSKYHKLWFIMTLNCLWLFLCWACFFYKCSLELLMLVGNYWKLCVFFLIENIKHTIIYNVLTFESFNWESPQHITNACIVWISFRYKVSILLNPDLFNVYFLSVSTFSAVDSMVSRVFNVTIYPMD